MIIIIDDKQQKSALVNMVRTLFKHDNDVVTLSPEDVRSHAGSVLKAARPAASGLTIDAKAQAVKMLKAGYATEAITVKTGLRAPVIRAYKAHITMGTY